MGIYIQNIKIPTAEERNMIPWIYADIDEIIDFYSEPPKEETE